MVAASTAVAIGQRGSAAAPAGSDPPVPPTPVLIDSLMGWRQHNALLLDRSANPCVGESVLASSQASEALLPGIWLRWVALAPQWPMSRIAASTTQNQSQPLSPRPGVYKSK
jgi:hypothetical protein